MKKVLGFGLLMSSLVLAEEFNLDTEIKGEIKKTYETSREIIGEISEVAPETKDIIDIELINEVKIENVEGIVEKVELDLIEEDLNLDLGIDETIGEIDELIEEADSDNYFSFGVGGFDSLDSFNYGIKYSNEIKEQGLDYKINIDRDIRGEDKTHTDVSKDLFSVEVNYQEYEIAIEHQIKDQEYYGGGERKLSETELSLRYEVKSTPKNSIYAGFDIYRGGSESSQSRRDYDNLYLNVYGEYDEIIQQDKISHILETKGGYYIDDLESTNTNVLYAEAYDKLKHEDYEGYELDLNAGIEVVNKDVESNSVGLNAGAKIIKKMNDKINIAAFLSREEKNSTTREIMNGLAYVSDILMFQNSSGDETELKAEDNYTLGTSMDYTEKNLFSEVALKFITSKDKIAYTAVDYGDEKAIEAGNYSDDLNWTELEAKAAYTMNEFRGELVAKYSSLDELAFVPSFTTTLTGIYDKEKTRVQADMKVYSDMYSEVEGVSDRDKVSGYASLDITYAYRFNSLVEGSVVVTNLMGANEEIMEDYEIDERKITLECKVKY